MSEVRVGSQIETWPISLEAIDAIGNARKSGVNRGLLNMATGLGKTRIAAHDVKSYLEENPDGRVLYLCHQNDILHQARKTFENVLGPNVSHGYAFGGAKEDRTQVVYASFQTMNSRFSDGKLYQAFDPGEFPYIIDDEGHHSQASSHRNVIDYFEPEFLLGMSATPDRQDGRDIMDIFEKELYRKTLEEGLAEDLLTPVDYRTYTDHLRAFGNTFLTSLPEGFTLSSLNRELFIPLRDDEIAEEIFKKIEELKNPHVLAFCQSIEHANHWANILPEAAAIHSGLPPNVQADLKSAFRSREIPIACVVDGYNEGIDVPDVNLVAFLRTTTSQRIWLQQLGRGLRLSKGKDKVTVMDFAADLDRIDMVLRLDEAVAKQREENASKVTRLDSPVQFSFSEDAKDVISLVQAVREKIEQRKQEIKVRDIRPLTISVPIDWVAPLKRREELPTEPHEVDLSVEQVLYLDAIYDSPDGCLGEAQLQDAFKAQFRKRIGIKEVRANLDELKELGIVSPVLDYGKKKRKLWRLNSDAVAALADTELYKSRTEKVHYELAELLLVMRRQAEQNDVNLNAVTIFKDGEDPTNWPIAASTILSFQEGAVEIAFDRQLYPQGTPLYDFDHTQLEGLLTMDSIVGAHKTGRIKELEVHSQIFVKPQGVETSHNVMRDLHPIPGRGEFKRRMTLGETESLTAKLKDYKVYYLGLETVTTIPANPPSIETIKQAVDLIHRTDRSSDTKDTAEINAKVDRLAGDVIQSIDSYHNREKLLAGIVLAHSLSRAYDGLRIKIMQAQPEILKSVIEEDGITRKPGGEELMQTYFKLEKTAANIARILSDKTHDFGMEYAMWHPEDDR